MTITRSTRHLRLLKFEEKGRRPPLSGAISSALIQGLLFPLPKPNIIWFIDVSLFEHESFVRILEEAPPRRVFDIRAAPRFDFGRVTRAEIFRAFQKLGVQYVDMLGSLGVSEYQNAQLNPALLAGSVNSVLQSDRSVSTGPIMFLFDNRELMEAAASEFPSRLEPQPKDGWEVIRLSS